MGRYYNGDIEGKFWFAVQASDAADRFGVIGREPNYLYYYFQEDDLPRVQEELEKIEEILGDNLPKMKEFFAMHNGYTDEMLQAHLNVDLVTARMFLREYADYGLGLQIRQCLAETGECEFEAEL